MRKLNPASGYTEKHHILPKSMGGSNEEENLVKLTAREHYIAHLLLHKIHKRRETAYALWMMSLRSSTLDDRPHIKNSRIYEWVRKDVAKYTALHGKKCVGAKNSMYGRKWIHNPETMKNSTMLKDDPIPDGWVVGKKQKKEAKPRKKYNHKRGYVVSDVARKNISDGLVKRHAEGKLVNKIYLEEKLRLGWTWKQIELDSSVSYKCLKRYAEEWGIFDLHSI